MGDVIAFRQRQPIIHVEGGEIGPCLIRIRPLPEDQPSLLSFGDIDGALDHAIELQRQHGWEIRVSDRIRAACRLDGAA